MDIDPSTAWASFGTAALFVGWRVYRSLPAWRLELVLASCAAMLTKERTRLELDRMRNGCDDGA
jgi:hypothetical protein